MKQVTFLAALLVLGAVWPTVGLGQMRVPTTTAPAAGSGDPRVVEQLGLFDANRRIASDGRQTDDERRRAAKAAIDALDALERLAPNDPRRRTWQADRINMLIDGLIEPCSKRVIYEVASNSDRDLMGRSVEEAATAIVRIQPGVIEDVTRLENGEKFDTPEYRLLDTMRNTLEYQKALMEYYRAQLLWASGKARPGAAELAVALAKVKAFFEDWTKDEQPKGRMPARGYYGWALLFANQNPEAVAQATAILGEEDTDGSWAGAKFEATCMKIQALRQDGVKLAKGSKLQAALDEQAALITSTILKDAPIWRLLHLLAKANCEVHEVASAGREKFEQALEMEKQKKPAEAAKLRDEAESAYQTAREKASNAILDAVKNDAPAAKLGEVISTLVYKDTVLDSDKGATSRPDPPTPEKLAGMSLTRVKTEAERTYRGGFYDIAALYYEELHRKAVEAKVEAGQRSDLLFSLGQCYYFWAQQLERANKRKDALVAYAKCGAKLDEMLKLVPDHQQKAMALKFQWSALYKQGDVFTSPEKLKTAIELLEKLRASSTGAEQEETTITLGRAHWLSKNHRDAIREYGRIPTTNPHYMQCRAMMCRAIMESYPGKPDPGKLDITQARADLSVLSGYEGVVKAEIERVTATQPDLVTWKKPTTLPDAANPLAYDRYLGAAWRLEAGRLYFMLLGDSGLKQAETLLESVPKDYPDLLMITERARVYRVLMFLNAKQVDKATSDLLQLIKSHPEDAVGLTDMVLKDYEEDYKQQMAGGMKDQARQRAAAAEQFATVLIGQVAGLKVVSARAIERFKIRRARTLNWCGRYPEAVELLAPMYKPRPVDQEVTVDTDFTRDPNLIGEYGIALAGTKDYTRALECFDTMLLHRSEMWPELKEFSDLWWQALIGQNECYLEAGRELKSAYKSLTEYKRQADEQAGTRKPDEPDPRLPAWLLNRFMEVKNRLEQTEQVQKLNQGGGKPVKQASRETQSSGNMGHLLTLIGASAAGLVLVMVVAILRQRQARKHRVIIRNKAI